VIDTPRHQILRVICRERRSGGKPEGIRVGTYLGVQTATPPTQLQPRDDAYPRYSPPPTLVHLSTSLSPSTDLQKLRLLLRILLSADFTNIARGGRSTRSFQNQGLWAQLLSYIVPSDFVNIEMSHSDNGTPGAGSGVVEDRAALPGIGEEKFVIQNATGGTEEETVYIFGKYLRGMIADVREKGGIPALSGILPTMS